MSAPAPRHFLAAVALTLAVAGWGVTHAMIRWLQLATPIAEMSWPGLALAVFRYGLAGVVLVPWAVVILWRRRVLLRRDLWRLVAIGIVAAAYLLALNSAHSYGAAGLNAMLGQASPVVAFALGLVVLRERATVAKVAGLVVASAGGLWFAGIAVGGQLASDNVPAAAAIILGSAVLWSVYMVLAKQALRRWDALELSVVTLVLSGVLTAGLAQAATPEGLGGTLAALGELSAAGWAVVLYLALVAGLLCYVLHNIGLKRIEASRAAVFGYLLGPAALASATLLPGELHEALSMQKLGAAAVIILGVALVTRAGGEDADDSLGESEGESE